MRHYTRHAGLINSAEQRASRDCHRGSNDYLSRCADGSCRILCKGLCPIRSWLGRTTWSNFGGPQPRPVSGVSFERESMSRS